MNKFYYSLLVAVTMLLTVTSCSQEEDYQQQSSNGMTSFSISLDGAVGSRAAGDGLTADELFCEVYLGEEKVHRVSKPVSSSPLNVDLPLLNGETYNIIFWAQDKECTIYETSNLNQIAINYDENLLANQESYDAFYNALVDFKADGNNHKVELRRPFAQLNLGTSDWDEFVDALPENQVPVTATSVKVEGLANTFCPLTGEAKGDNVNPITAIFDYADLYSWQENGVTKDAFTVNGVDYKYLSLNYLLVPGTKTPNGIGDYEAETDNADKALVGLTFNLKRGDTVLKPIKVTNVPMRRNWRTNIIGDVLTGTSFDIVIEDDLDNDNNVGIESINGLTALNTALTNNTSEEQVIYNISGLSTTDNVTIEIPTTFVAAQVTFNLNDIKDDAKNLTIKDKDGGNYANTVCVSLPTTEGHNLGTTTITLPEAHVELLEGNFGDLSASTDDETIVIGSGATVGKLTVNKGNVEIYGTVTTIKAGEDNDAPIIVVLGENVAKPSIDVGEIIFKPENSIAQVGLYYYETLTAALDAIETEGTITMIADYENAESVSIPAGKTITLELNGFAICGTDDTEKNYGLIDNRGTLTITGEGKISVKATVNSGWNRYSAALANNPGGNLTVGKGVVVEHLGGTDMAYGIDNLTNGKGTSAIVTIDGATVKSPYRAIRQFLNGEEATNELYVKSGVIEGANKSVWMQDPNKNANTGKLVVSEDAQLKGDVYLFVTAGSTEWPVDVSIDADALAEDAEVLSGNVPAGYGVILEGGIYKVVQNGVNNYVLINGADELIAVAEAGIKNNEKVFLIGDIDLEGKTFGGLKATNFGGHNSFDGQGYTVSNWTYDGGASDMGFIQQWVGPVSNINFYNCHLKTDGRSAIAAGKIYGNIDNIHIDSSSIDDSYWACGAVAGLYNAGNITNCTVTNTTVKSNGGTGGIVGVINEEGGERALINCSVSNSTINNTGIYGASYSGGGLIGLFNAGEATYKIENCKVENNELVGEHIFETYPTIASASLDAPIK